MGFSSETIMLAFFIYLSNTVALQAKYDVNVPLCVYFGMVYKLCFPYPLSQFIIFVWYLRKRNTKHSIQEWREGQK